METRPRRPPKACARCIPPSACILRTTPRASVSAITAALLIPYLRTRPPPCPPSNHSTGATLTILVNVSPPVINAGSGVTYDPSGSNKDSLWDVGE